MKTANCKSCGAAIVWMKTTGGANMPVDAGTVDDSDTVFDYAKHKSHFATCPNADKHRK